MHTNSIEGVWVLFRRSIAGAFHKMNHKHMDRYVEELEWRFNHCDNPHIFRDTMPKIVYTDPMTYRQLIDGRRRHTCLSVNLIPYPCPWGPSRLLKCESIR